MSNIILGNPHKKTYKICTKYTDFYTEQTNKKGRTCYFIINLCLKTQNVK